MIAQANINDNLIFAFIFLSPVKVEMCIRDSSYAYQASLYNSYVAQDGQELADTYSARPGHSEHQSGLAFDIGALDNGYGNTPGGRWLNAHCADYGFILRYPAGKESITGYQYEPWHVRYVGKEIASRIMSQGITLEEYLGDV